MKLASLLLLFLFISCGGHLSHQTSHTQLRNHDCKTLFKKQKLQYKIAVRDSKLNQRRKKSAIPEYKPDRRANKIKNECDPVIFAPTTDNIDGNKGPLLPIYFQKEDISSGTSRIANAVLFTSPEGIIPLENQAAKKNSPKATRNQAVLTNFNASSLPLMAVGVAGVLGMALLKLFQNHAQQMSHWAKKNPWKMRGFIGIAQIGMGVSAFSLGNYLYETNIMIPDYARLSAAGMFAVAAIFYPSSYHANGSPAFSYLRRKFHDAALFTTGAMLTLYAGNHCHLTIQPTHATQIVSSAPITKQNIFSLKFATHQISVVKNEFQSSLKERFEDPKRGNTRGEKVALVILVSLAFTLLTVGVAAASCNLSCSGNEAAAIAVLVGGAAIIAWGLSASLKRIHRAPTIEKKTKAAEPSPQT
jgi:hypothetical protein